MQTCKCVNMHSDTHTHELMLSLTLSFSHTHTRTKHANTHAGTQTKADIQTQEYPGKSPTQSFKGKHRHKHYFKDNSVHNPVRRMCVAAQKGGSKGEVWEGRQRQGDKKKGKDRKEEREKRDITPFITTTCIHSLGLPTQLSSLCLGLQHGTLAMYQKRTSLTLKSGEFCRPIFSWNYDSSIRRTRKYFYTCFQRAETMM